MTHLGKFSIALTALGLLVAGPARAADDAVPAPRLLPPGVQAFVTVPDVPKLKDQWNETLLGRLRDEEELADFWRDVDAQLRKASADLEQEIGVSLEDLLAVPSGELTLAFVAEEGQTPGGVMLLDYGENEETINTLLETASEKLTEEGAERSTAEFEDTRLVIYTFPKDEEDQNSEERSVAYFLRDSYLVVATERSLLEAVLARWNGEHPKTFADDEVFQYVRQRSTVPNAEPALMWYVDPVRLVQTIVRTQDEADFQTQMAMSFLEPLGLTQIRGMGGAFDLATERYDVVNRTFIYVEPPAKGVLELARFPAVEQSPPDWAPADAPSYLQVNWDVQSAWAGLEKIVDSFQGMGAFQRIIDRAAQNENGPKVHPKKDVLDQLTGTVHVLTRPPEEEGDAAQPPQPDYLVALDLKDAQKIRDVLSRVAEAPNVPVEAREFQGETIYEIPTDPKNPAVGNALSLAVGQGQLLLSNDVTMIEGILRDDGDRKPLAETQEYRRIAEQFPEETSLIGYQRQDTQIKLLYNMLRSGRTELEIEGIDFTKLPEFEVIEKYLPPTGAYAVPDEHGALYVTFSLRKDER
ncbi:MAG: DUF3352 domain-containing protein [Planctomycetaceae bacterium]